MSFRWTVLIVKQHVGAPRKKKAQFRSNPQLLAGSNQMLEVFQPLSTDFVPNKRFSPEYGMVTISMA